MDYMDYYHSPLGEITLASDGVGLIGLWFDGQKNFGSTLLEGDEERNLSVFKQTHLWLDTYFRGKSPDFIPPMRLIGSPFQIRVWHILLDIPFGCVLTYHDIAVKMANKASGMRMSAQAIGGAVSRNPISLIVPCHRVVGSNGKLTGYAGGLERKQKLLQLECISDGLHL